MTLTATSHDWNTPFRAYDIEFIGTRVLTVGNGATADGNMGVAVWDRSTSTGRLWLTSVALAAQKCFTHEKNDPFPGDGFCGWRLAYLKLQDPCS